MDHITLMAPQWREIGTRIFRSWGASEAAAWCVANSLVGADLAGVYSHGIMRIPHYYRQLQAGWLQPTHEPTVSRETATLAFVEGNWGFGQPAAHLGLDLALAKARSEGIAAAGIIHSGHIGRLGEYAEKAAAQNMIALVFASSGPFGGQLAPYGGVEQTLGTNPIAAGVPTGERPPFVMDFASSVVASGKVMLLPGSDSELPPGWAQDAEGRPAATVRDFQNGGSLLPAGGHKGYAFAVLVELLCGALLGAGVTQRPQQKRPLGAGGNATFIIALDVEHFRDMPSFTEEVAGLYDRLHGVRPAPGFDEVLVPGEPELRQRARQESEGIRVRGDTWQKIAAVAAERGVALDDIVDEVH